jgi:hypothetical protein
MITNDAIDPDISAEPIDDPSIDIIETEEGAIQKANAYFDFEADLSSRKHSNPE